MLWGMPLPGVRCTDPRVAVAEQGPTDLNDITPTWRHTVQGGNRFSSPRGGSLRAIDVRLPDYQRGRRFDRRFQVARQTLNGHGWLQTFRSGRTASPATVGQVTLAVAHSSRHLSLPQPPLLTRGGFSTEPRMPTPLMGTPMVRHLWDSKPDLEHEHRVERCQQPRWDRSDVDISQLA